ncbi:MaoC family dehydratase [Peribacillus loiseleuriae]|uniref:Enoyl-CoA hydratase n=1 Tax=Peribacillus loiseleuriae TaxID=1679170 RepID=A0A0K9GX58_9BACI|nr:MaoC/PaaZ C-terminal domain-containing protein [Peribacillus loiseleuriae]KMY51216.1 enoyl-CoA hydratase [Peribacillus loiseleuriae]
MMLLKNRKLGRKIEEIKEGETLTLTEKMEDKDLLLYLGLTNDANPLYVQHDYASQTTYKKPLVPSIMLIGMVTSAVSKYLPGPGSYILSHHIEFPNPVHHYETIKFRFEVKEVKIKENEVVIEIVGENEDGSRVLNGRIKVCPPSQIKGMGGTVLENF